MTRAKIENELRDAVAVAQIDKEDAAVVAAIGAVHRTGRPILVGTGSIRESDHLSRRLIAEGRVTGGGRKSFFSAVEMKDDLGNPVANAIATMRWRGNGGGPMGDPE